MEKINTLWHFGDSFGCWGNPEQPDREAQIGFSQYIAQHYNVNFEHLAQQGASNDEITKRIISSMSKFRENDIILINWSFFTRYSFTNKYGKVKNINHVLNKISTAIEDLNPGDLEYDKFEFTSQEYYDYIFFQKSSFVIEESIIHWQNFINPILLYIQNSLRCTVISTFNDLVLHADYMSKSNPSKYISDWSNLDDLNIIPILDDSLHEIIWDNENSKYIRFLENNNYYKNGEDVHYKFGVQEELSKEWIKRLDSQFNLSEKYNKKTLL